GKRRKAAHHGAGRPFAQPKRLMDGGTLRLTRRKRGPFPRADAIGRCYASMPSRRAPAGAARFFDMRPPIKIQSFLVNLPFFAGVPDAVIDRIAAETTEMHVPRGEILFTRGDACRGFFLVIYGHAKLSL